MIAEIFESRQRGQAERLIPLCQQVCQTAQVGFEELDHIAVTRGPGTFTGVRIGVAAAKGLALALKVPLIGVTTLETVACQALEESVPPLKGQIAVAHDARRGEVYWQTFNVVNKRVVAVSEPQAVPLQNLQAHLTADVARVVGTGAGLVKLHVPENQAAGLIFSEDHSQPVAATVGRIAAEKVLHGAVDQAVTPLYLRAPDAIAAKPVHYAFQNQ